MFLAQQVFRTMETCEIAAGRCVSKSDVKFASLVKSCFAGIGWLEERAEVGHCLGDANTGLADVVVVKLIRLTFVQRMHHFSACYLKGIRCCFAVGSGASYKSAC